MSRLLLILFLLAVSAPFCGAQADADSQLELTNSETLIVDAVMEVMDTDQSQNGELTPEAAQRLIELATALDSAEVIANNMPVVVLLLILSTIPHLFRATRVSLFIQALAFALMYLVPLGVFQVLSLGGLVLTVGLLFYLTYRGQDSAKPVT